jgi:hypothetical protein
VLVMGLLTVLACDGPLTSQPTASVPTPIPPPVAAELRLPRDAKTDRPVSGTYIAIERSTQDWLDRAWENRDPRALDAAVTLGDVFWLDHGQSLTILTRDAPMAWVQVDGGPMNGRRGWVSERYVKRK